MLECLCPSTCTEPRREYWIFCLLYCSLSYHLKVWSLIEPGACYWTMKLLGSTCLHLIAGLLCSHSQAWIYLDASPQNSTCQGLYQLTYPSQGPCMYKISYALSITMHSIITRACISQALTMAHLCRRVFLYHITWILSIEGHIEKPIKLLKQRFT